MRAPKLSDLGVNLREDLTRFAAPGYLSSISQFKIDIALSGDCEKLRDELSSAFTRLYGMKAQRGQDILERRVVVEFYEAFEGGLCWTDFEEFRQQMHFLVAAVTGNKRPWRVRPIAFAKDAANILVEFPDAADIVATLRAAFDTAVECEGAHPLFGALCFHILMLNAHPFTDGNGRTARMILNLMLHRMGVPRSVYVPFSAFTVKSAGGYQIAIRRAETTGQWEAYFRYFLSLLELIMHPNGQQLPTLS